MANLAKSLDQHETQDIHVTVPSNALYSQCTTTLLFYGMNVPFTCPSKKYLVILFKTYLYLILVISEGKKRRLQIGKGSSYFYQKIITWNFGEIHWQIDTVVDSTHYKNVKICVRSLSICHAEENLNKFIIRKKQQTSVLLEVI